MEIELTYAEFEFGDCETLGTHRITSYSRFSDGKKQWRIEKSKSPHGWLFVMENFLTFDEAVLWFLAYAKSIRSGLRDEYGELKAQRDYSMAEIAFNTAYSGGHPLGTTWDSLTTEAKDVWFRVANAVIEALPTVED